MCRIVLFLFVSTLPLRAYAVLAVLKTSQKDFGLDVLSGQLGPDALPLGWEDFVCTWDTASWMVPEWMTGAFTDRFTVYLVPYESMLTEWESVGLNGRPGSAYALRRSGGSISDQCSGQKWRTRGAGPPEPTRLFTIGGVVRKGWLQDSNLQIIPSQAKFWTWSMRPGSGDTPGPYLPTCEYVVVDYTPTRSYMGQSTGLVLLNPEKIRLDDPDNFEGFNIGRQFIEGYSGGGQYGEGVGNVFDATGSGGELHPWKAALEIPEFDEGSLPGMLVSIPIPGGGSYSLNMTPIQQVATLAASGGTFASEWGELLVQYRGAVRNVLLLVLYTRAIRRVLELLIGDSDDEAGELENGSREDM